MHVPAQQISWDSALPGRSGPRPARHQPRSARGRVSADGDHAGLVAAPIRGPEITARAGAEGHVLQNPAKFSCMPLLRDVQIPIRFSGF